MMKNEDELVWRVYAQSVIWFTTYAECKKSALKQEIHVPDCAAVRLYIEVYHNGIINVVEILSQNDPDKEPPTDDGEDNHVIKYKWEWRVCHPSDDNGWKSLAKSTKFFKTLKECKENGKSFEVDAECSAKLKFCIQMWHDNDCILETYYDEEELR